jgi:patatin-like phospholipase/acyl hydrolase
METQKAILALDGGGLRGAFTLGFLGELESLIARHTGKAEDFVLADYFDFIGGTSTGAIIATGLSLGWRVDTLTRMYRELGSAVFHKRKFLPLRAWSKYPGKPLQKQLASVFGDRTFGDPDLRTTLMIVMHNRTSDSPWPLCNYPGALYNRGDEKATHHNLEQRLCDLLSASTAAPAFFPSTTLDLGAGAREFVDGGVTAHNNPALQMFLTATIPEYAMNWPTGPDKMLVVSVGTGFAPARLRNLSRLRRHIIYVATNTPTGLMFAAANHNDVVCRTLGENAFRATPRQRTASHDAGRTARQAVQLRALQHRTRRQGDKEVRGLRRART